MEPNLDNESPHGEWSDLPDHIRGNINTFLGWKDRLNMPLVSHKWEEGHSCPSLWENFTFKLTNSQLSMATSPLSKSAREYGKFFKHVKIYLDRSECKLFPNIWHRWLMEFLEILTRNSKLVSVEFYNLSYLLWTRECANMCRVIADFLGSQHQLERVEFFNCSIRFPDGAEFVRQLARKNGESLRHLRLRGFVSNETRSDRQVLNFSLNLPTLSDFLNLETLDIDYSLIFVNMFSRECFQTLKNCKMRPALSKIILAYDLPLRNSLYGSERRDFFPGLKSPDWLFLKKLLPNLQVELIIETPTLSQQNLKFLIKPDMPISRLEYMNGDIENAAKLLHRLKFQTIDRLVSLHLRMCPPGEDLASPIIRFLSSCKKLKLLELLVSDSTNMRHLIAYWLKNPPEHLEKLIIHISGINDDEHYRMIHNLRSEYESQLKSLGMNAVVDIMTES